MFCPGLCYRNHQPDQAGYTILVGKRDSYERMVVFSSQMVLLYQTVKVNRVKWAGLIENKWIEGLGGIKMELS